MTAKDQPKPTTKAGQVLVTDMEKLLKALNVDPETRRDIERIVRIGVILAEREAQA